MTGKITKVKVGDVTVTLTPVENHEGFWTATVDGTRIGNVESFFESAYGSDVEYKRWSGFHVSGHRVGQPWQKLTRRDVLAQLVKAGA